RETRTAAEVACRLFILLASGTHSEVWDGFAHRESSERLVDGRWSARRMLSKRVLWAIVGGCKSSREHNRTVMGLGCWRAEVGVVMAYPEVAVHVHLLLSRNFLIGKE